ncbi:hypothetical protein DFQ27_004944 [Actinomortierella ambigua]|uniref:BAG domain-containing protein n=1 Tax=Actinomortierella ambigua TaxID=1343610 RepID=A0A9P6Q038_9FUNG|nr:hypothetical protein DFQ27_004944 [Actinomortierella ambigua]
MYSIFEPAMAPRSSRRSLQQQHPYYHQQAYQHPMFTSWIPANELDESDEEERLLREALARKQQQRQARQYQYQLQLQREQELAAEQERQRQRQYEIRRAKAIAEREAEQQRQRRIRQQQLEAQRAAAIEEIFRRQLAHQEEQEQQERLRRQRAAAAALEASRAREAAKKRQEEEKKKQHQLLLMQQAESEESSTESDAESEVDDGDLLQDIFQSLFFPQHKRPAADRALARQPSKRVHRRARAEQKRIEQAKHEAEVKAKAEAEAKARAEAEAKQKAAAEAKKQQQQQQEKAQLKQQKIAAYDSDNDEDPVHSYFATFPDIQQFVEAALGAKIQPTNSCPAGKARTSLKPTISTTSTTPKKVTIQAPAEETAKVETTPALAAAPQSPVSSPELRAADIVRERLERQRKEEKAKETKHSELNKIESALDDLSHLLERVVQGLVENKRQIYQVEEDVTKTMIRIDSVESNGDHSIRKRRKELIKKSQSLLDAIDNHKDLLAKQAAKQAAKEDEEKKKEKSKHATTVEDAPVTPAIEKELEITLETIEPLLSDVSISSEDDESSSSEIDTPSNSDTEKNDRIQKEPFDILEMGNDPLSSDTISLA